MRLADRIRRWWHPAEWRDEHPQVSDGETLSKEQRAELHQMQYRDAGSRSHTGLRGGREVALPSELDEEGRPDVQPGGSPSQ